MNIASKIAALLVVVRRQDVNALCPAERKRLADLCRFVADIAEPPPVSELKSGVLFELKHYRRQS